MNTDPPRRHLQAVPDPQSDYRFTAVRQIDGDAGEPVPEAVRAAMSRAAELWESLREDGKQLRYEVDSESGRVSVDLFDLEGDRLRAVPLAEALGVSDDDSPAA